VFNYGPTWMWTNQRALKLKKGTCYNDMHQVGQEVVVISGIIKDASYIDILDRLDNYVILLNGKVMY